MSLNDLPNPMHLYMILNIYKKAFYYKNRQVTKYCFHSHYLFFLSTELINPISTDNIYKRVYEIVYV